MCAQDLTDPDATLHPLPGDHSVVAPPVPIPNTEVKRNRADGSVILSCKSRSSPGSLPETPVHKDWGFLLSYIGAVAGGNCSMNGCVKTHLHAVVYLASAAYFAIIRQIILGRDAAVRLTEIC